MRVFDFRVLRRTFGPRREEVTGEWRKLHNVDLNYLYSSPIIVRVITSRKRWEGHIVRMGEKRGVYRVLVGNPEGKRPLWRPRRRLEDNIKMDLQDVGCGGYGLDRAGSVQGQVAGTCECGMNLQVPENERNFLTG